MKLIFSDVDNTLIEKGKSLSNEMISAIKHATINDVEFIFCSGRPTYNLKQIANSLLLQGIELNYVAGFNGAEIINLNNNETIINDGLSTKQVHEIIAVLKEVQVEYMIYDEEVIYGSDTENEFIVFEALQNDMKLNKLLDVSSSIKVLAVEDPKTSVEKYKLIKEKLKNYTVLMSTEFFIEITNNNVTKGHAMLKMIDILDIPLVDVYTFGDAGNDFTLIEFAINGIAVGNATKEIKEIACDVIDTVSNNGVAKYIMNKLGE